MKLKCPPILRLIKFFSILWAVATVFCLASLIAAIAFFSSKGDTFLFTNIEDVPIYAWIGIFIVGCLSFGFGSFLLVWKELGNRKWWFKLTLIPFVGAIFPLYLLIKLIQPGHLLKQIRINKLKVFKPKSIKFTIAKIGTFLLIVGLIFPVWLFAYIAIYYVVGQAAGVVEDGMNITATGSMYPTFPKRDDLSREEQREIIAATPGMLKYPGLIPFFGAHTIGRGDIVTFESEKTHEITSKDGKPSGLAKRVVALGGDKIEIRGGIFNLNGELQKEKYIARARSTFGGQFLPDCKVVEVPQGEVFVMGDNRKGSGDSRHELGFVKLSDIDHVIPWVFQKGVLDQNWHDVTNDLEDSAKIHMDKNKYLELLNEERKKNGAKPLKYQTKLEKSAGLRGEAILKYDDLSWEATQSGYPMWKSLRDVKYSNIIYGEVPSLGWYEEDELIENFLAFPDWKKYLLNKNFQEIGIAEVELIVGGCPKQITVAHFAGYVPPNYSTEIINSWKQSLNGLKNIQSAWLNLKNYGRFYGDHRQEVDRINEIIALRISRISTAIAKMETQKWLTVEESKWLEEDATLTNEQDGLATKLNNY